MRIFIAVAMFCSLLTTNQALAWGQGGHSIIAELAQRHLSADTLKAIRDLMGGEISLASKASWADDYKFTAEGKHTKSWHFVDIDIRKAEYDPSDCQDHGNQGCLVSAIPEQIAIIRDHSKSNDERRQALLLLVHLMGDLEQPLHASNNGNDFGGNTLWVHMDAKRPDGHWLNRVMKFHAMWDEGLIDLHVYDWGAYADEIDKAALPTVKPGPYDTARIVAWADDTHCAGIEAYRLLKPSLPKAPDGECHGIDGAKIPNANEETSPVDVGNRYTDPATKIVTAQLAKGGARLAAVLEYAFSP